MRRGWVAAVLATMVCCAEPAEDCTTDSAGAGTSFAGGGTSMAVTADKARRAGLPDAVLGYIAGVDPVAAPETASALASMVDAILVLLEDQRAAQRQLCEQQQAEADASLLAKLQQYVAREDKTKKAMAAEALGLNAELKQCTEAAAASAASGPGRSCRCARPSVAGGGTPDDHLLLRRSAPTEPEPAAPSNGRHQGGTDNVPPDPDTAHSTAGAHRNANLGDARRLPRAEPELGSAQQPQYSFYQGPRPMMTAEQREDVRINRLYRELDRRERSSELPAAIEQYTDASGTEVRAGAGVGRNAPPARRALSRHIPFEHIPTHSAVHAEAVGFHDQADWCASGPTVADDVFPRFKTAFAGVECVELGPGDAVYIPEGYWHWVFSAGFGVAINLWTGSPHRRLTRPKKFPAGAADWPAVRTWTPETAVGLWAGGWHGTGARTGAQDGHRIDTKITCSPDPAKNFVLPEAIARHDAGDRSDGLVDLAPDEFLRLATAVHAGEPTNMSCMHLSAVRPDTPLGRSKDYRFKATADAVSNVSVLGSTHRIVYPGAGPELNLDWGYPDPWHSRDSAGEARKLDQRQGFDSAAEAMAHAGVASFGELMEARDAFNHEQPTVNLWMTLGKVQSGLHYDDSYNTLVVVRGKKRVLLFPRNLSGSLYPVVARPEPVAEFDDRLTDVRDAFDLMLSETPDPGKPGWPLDRGRADSTEHAFNTVTKMLKRSSGLEYVIALLLAGELMAHHGEMNLARELLNQVKGSSNVANGDVPALIHRANAALATLPPTAA